MMTMRKRTVAQLLIAGLTVAVCISVANISSAIMVRPDDSSHTQGTHVQYYDLAARKLANRNRYQAVGQVVMYAGGIGISHCTGTLIDIPGLDNRYVLTAGHCVDNAEELAFRLGSGGNDLYMAPNVLNFYGSFDADVDFTDPVFAEAWISHPDWTGNLVAGGDVALLRLEESFDDIKPATVRDPGNGINEVGTNIVSVGYGRTGDGAHGTPHRVMLGPGQLSGAYWMDVQKRAAQNTVLALRSMGSPPVHLISRFDRHISDVDYINPDDPRGDRYDFDMDLPRPYEGLISPGDSGGPVFDERRHEIIGVHSWGLNPFAGRDGDPIAEDEFLTFMGNVRLSLYYDWIFEAAEELDELMGGDGGAGDGEGGLQARTGQLGLPGKPISDELLVNRWHRESGISYKQIRAALEHPDYGPDLSQAILLDAKGNPIAGPGVEAGGGGGANVVRRGRLPRGGGGGGGGGLFNDSDPMPELQPSQGEQLLEQLELERLDQEKEPTVDPEAWEEYLRLRDLWMYKYRLAETEEERQQLRLEWRKLSMEKDPRNKNYQSNTDSSDGD